MLYPVITHQSIADLESQAGNDPALKQQVLAAKKMATQANLKELEQTKQCKEGYFGNYTINNKDFSNVDLTGALFDTVTLTATNFNNAHLTLAVFISTSIE